MSQVFESRGQSIGVSASASVLPMNIQGWFPLGLTGLSSFQSKGLSRVFSRITVQKHQFFNAQPSLWLYCCNCYYQDARKLSLQNVSGIQPRSPASCLSSSLKPLWIICCLDLCSKLWNCLPVPHFISHIAARALFFFLKEFFHVDHLKNLYWICYNVPSILCFACSFGLWGIWDLSSLTRGWTHIPCIGRWNLNH